MIGVTITPSQIDYSKIITPDVMDEIITGECVILTGFAKGLAPVAIKNGGQLKNSIMWKTSKSKGSFNNSAGPQAPNEISNPGTLEGYVGSNLEYAGPVEYGRKDMPNYPRQPYLRPAIDYSAKQRSIRQKKIINDAIKAAKNG